jgi:membrane protein
MAATSKEDGLARALASQLWRLIVTTTSSCMRYRVTGLAAEAAFFAVLSMPPLVFALAGAIGYVSGTFTAAQVDELRTAVVEVSSRAMTDSAVEKIILPTFDDVVGGGRFDVISIGFILALWSGSRALNVFVDTITIMHGLGGHRGIVKTRALSFLLYVMGLVTGVITLPLVIAGPNLVQRVIPERVGFLNDLYWPTVIVLCICFLATLYHVSVPVRTLWRYNLPGATFSLVCWVFGSYLLRWVLTATAADSRSVYGPLAAPIAVLLWLYLVSIAVLIGAAVNAACDTLFPQGATQSARTRPVRRLGGVLPHLATKNRTSPKPRDPDKEPVPEGPASAKPQHHPTIPAARPTEPAPHPPVPTPGPGEPAPRPAEAPRNADRSVPD